MTDGPFKNLPLSKSLKRFAVAVQNDAVDDATRCALAGNALVRGVLSECQPLLNDLQNYGQGGQLDFDPKESVRSIFENHAISEFSNHLQREILQRLNEGKEPKAAINNGLKVAVEADIGNCRTRVQEAGLEAYREGSMRKGQFDRLIKGCNRTLERVDRPRILEALKSGNKNAFRKETRIRKGLNDGPRL